jgi:hypothetical protein
LLAEPLAAWLGNGRAFGDTPGFWVFLGVFA